MYKVLTAAKTHAPSHHLLHAFIFHQNPRPDFLGDFCLFWFYFFLTAEWERKGWNVSYDSFYAWFCFSWGILVRRLVGCFFGGFLVFLLLGLLEVFLVVVVVGLLFFGFFLAGEKVHSALTRTFPIWWLICSTVFLLVCIWVLFLIVTCLFLLFSDRWNGSCMR